MIALLRFTIGRWLIHVGLGVMPPGRSRSLITAKLLEVRDKIERGPQK